jgi:hypothetical protein
MSKKPAPPEGQNSEQTPDLAGSSSHDLFALVPFYNGDQESIFFHGQEAANDDYVNGRAFSKSLRFYSADFRSGYQHEWTRLDEIRLANDERVHHYQRGLASITGLGLW